MCRRKTCAVCHKPTWAGCGAHVEQVLAGVPPAGRCSCPPGTPYERSGLLARILGRKPAG